MASLKMNSVFLDPEEISWSPRDEPMSMYRVAYYNGHSLIVPRSEWTSDLIPSYIPPKRRYYNLGAEWWRMEHILISENRKATEELMMKKINKRLANEQIQEVVKKELNSKKADVVDGDKIGCWPFAKLRKRFSKKNKKVNKGYDFSEQSYGKINGKNLSIDKTNEERIEKMIAFLTKDEKIPKFNEVLMDDEKELSFRDKIYEASFTRLCQKAWTFDSEYYSSIKLRLRRRCPTMDYIEEMPGEGDNCGYFPHMDFPESEPYEHEPEEQDNNINWRFRLAHNLRIFRDSAAYRLLLLRNDVNKFIRNAFH